MQFFPCVHHRNMLLPFNKYFFVPLRMQVQKAEPFRWKKLWKTKEKKSSILFFISYDETCDSL